ncbi:hypothetical protein D3C73_1300790 [compost metagenome]
MGVKHPIALAKIIHLGPVIDIEPIPVAGASSMAKAEIFAVAACFIYHRLHLQKVFISRAGKQ